TLQHVVVNYDLLDGRSIYVNGELVADDTEAAGHLNDWDDNFALAVGNEVDNQQMWQSTVRFLAVHSRVLTPEQIVSNYDAG
ncbi:LamG-like jellyroll fold domain-containing protein, partial [Saccharophagus degradans]